MGGAPFRLEPGQWTDDISMALCLDACRHLRAVGWRLSRRPGDPGWLACSLAMRTEIEQMAKTLAAAALKRQAKGL